MKITRPVLLILAALGCLIVAELIQTSVIASGNVTAWLIGAAIALVAAKLP